MLRMSQPMNEIVNSKQMVKWAFYKQKTIFYNGQRSPEIPKPYSMVCEITCDRNQPDGGLCQVCPKPRILFHNTYGPTDDTTNIKEEIIYQMDFK